MPLVLDESLRELRETVRAGALNRPGIYRMIGSTGAVVYVGKSKRLRRRLMGYFRAKEEEKAWRIVRDAAAIDWEYVPNEFAALLRELELIKRHRPPHNVRQKREGIYCFLRIGGGRAPRLHVVRRIRDDSATYYGPFLGGRRITDAVKELNDVLLLRDCPGGIPIHYADQEDLFGVERDPHCSRYELLRCSAPCAGRVTAAEYRGRLSEARAFLNGESERPLRDLRARMEEAVERWQFELAASLQTRIERLELLRYEFLRQLEATERLSFLYMVPGYDDGDHCVYAIRAGSVRGCYPAPETRGERRALLRAAAEHYAVPESTAEVTTPRRVDQLLLVSHWFRTRPGELANAYERDRWGELPLARDLAMA